MRKLYPPKKTVTLDASNTTWYNATKQTIRPHIYWGKVRKTHVIEAGGSIELPASWSDEYVAKVCKYLRKDPGVTAKVNRGPAPVHPDAIAEVAKAAVVAALQNTPGPEPEPPQEPVAAPKPEVVADMVAAVEEAANAPDDPEDSPPVVKKPKASSTGKKKTRKRKTSQRG